MLQENSKKIWHYRILEAMCVACWWFIGLGVLALFTMGLFFILNIFDPFPLSTHWPLRFIINATITLGVISGIAFLVALVEDVPLGEWLAEIPAGTIVLDEETKKVIEVQDEDIVLMKDHPFFGERYKFLIIEDEINISVTVHPMTENPKVRNITCQLYLKIKERSCAGLQTLFDFLHLNEGWKISGNGVIWVIPVRSMLHDFCNDHSRELSELFNPFRKEQVARFESMVHAYFDPLLAQSGIEIKSCCFLVG